MSRRQERAEQKNRVTAKSAAELLEADKNQAALDRKVFEDKVTVFEAISPEELRRRALGKLVILEELIAEYNDGIRVTNGGWFFNADMRSVLSTESLAYSNAALLALSMEQAGHQLIHHIDS
jgi:hypothetical protein